MALPTIIAVNQTGGAILLTRMGLTVPASSSLTLSDYAYREEIWGDESLYAFVVAGDIVLNLGQGALSTAESLKFWNLIPFQPVASSVRALRDSNVASLSGTITVDGVSLVAGDRVLLTAQGTGAQNGVWVVQAGAWARPDDFGAGQSAAGLTVAIEGEGTIYKNQIWVCSTTPGSDVIGTDTLAFTAAASGAGSTTLQQAYENGNTITTSAGEGNLTFTTGAGAPIEFVLTGDDFTVNGANDVNFGGSVALASFNLDTSGAITVDSSGAGISIDGAGASNFSTSSGDLTLAATTNSVVITGAEGAADAVQINASNAAGGIDINAGTAGIAVDTTGPLSLDGTGTAANLTLTANAAGTAALVIAATNAGAGAGNLNVSADDAITLDSASFSIDGTSASNVSTTAAGLTLSTITSGTLAVTSAGALNLSSATTTDIQATGNLTLDSSGGTIGIGTDANTGAINIGTGAAARAITLGNTTGATSTTIQAGTGNISLQADRTTITGDLVVQGTTTTVDSETVLIADNHLYLNQGYATAVAVTGGLVVNYLPIATTDTVAAGGFVAGVPATSNPTIATTGAATFAVGQFIQISGANNPDNNGLYEVLSHAANVLTVRGVGTTATVEDFTQNQFTTDTTVAGSITRVTISVIRSGTDGVWETAAGASTALTFQNLLTTASTTLQQAYQGGNTIAVTSGEGPLAITLTSDDFTVNGANDVDFGGSVAVSTFNVDSAGAVTVNGAAASNLSVTGAGLTLSTITSGTLAVTSAGALNLSGTTGDWQSTSAVTIDSSGGAISIGSDANAQAINIGTGAAARTITMGNVTGATSLVLNAGTGNIDIGTTAQARTTNLATGAAAQVLTMGSTTGVSSATLRTGTGAMTFTAGGIFDVNATGAVTIDSSGGAISIGSDANAQAINVGTGAAARTVTVGNNTGATAVVVNSGTEQVQIDGVTYYGNSSGAPTARGGGFQDGDKYYDTGLDLEMRYDSGRGKWLSVEAVYYYFGRDGNIPSGSYFRGAADGLVMSSTSGFYAPHNGTVVGLGYTRSDSDAATFDVVEGGTSRATLATAATAGISNALNGNFTAGGIIAVINQAAGNTMSDVQAWVKLKWRS